MVTYVVTTRDAKGAKHEEEILAENRADLFRQLEASGRRAVSVREGKLKKRRASGVSGGGRPTVLRGAVAGAFVVLLASAVFFFFSRKEMPTTDKGKATRKSSVAEVAPAVSRKTTEGNLPQTKARSIEAAMERLSTPEKTPIKLRALTPEEWDQLTNRTFKTGTEQLMSWVFSTEPGDMPMPIPRISDEDRKNIVGILISKNEIKDSDSERTIECKEAVAAAKREMMQYLKEGGDPDDFLQYYSQELKRAFEMRNEAVNQVQEVWDEDPELGKEFLDKINERFKEEGIKEIKKEQFE